MEKRVFVVLSIINCIAIAIVIYLYINASKSTPKTHHHCDITFTEKDVIVNCRHRGLTSVPTHTFPANSTNIDLGNNKLSRIAGVSFGCLKYLQRLDLTANRIKYLERGSFHCLPNLTKLLLRTNSLNFSYEALPVGLFSGLGQLKELVLGDNNPNINWAYPEVTFMNLTSLERLELPSPPILTFGSGFAKMTKIIELTLLGGGSPHISNDSFNVFSMMNITTFMIMYTRAENIDRMSLRAFSMVQSLSIVGLYVGLPSLLMTLNVYSGRTMSLINFKSNSYPAPWQHNDNHYTILTPKETRYLLAICVEKVYLKSNRISSIRRGTFNKEPFMGCIKYLDLSNNCILVDSGLYLEFRTLRNLESFSMYMGECTNSIDLGQVSTTLKELSVTLNDNGDKIWNRPIQSLRLDCHGRTLHIHLPENLKSLQLNGILEDFSVYNCTFQVHGSQNLTLLDVSSWYFYSEESSLVGLENLLSLRYANNFGRLSSDFVFHNSKNLQSLILDYTTFDTVWQDMEPKFSVLTQIFKNLNVLSLKNTGLKEFPLKPDPLANLSFVDVSENSISYLDSDIRLGLDERVQKAKLSLDLSGNVLSCGCGSLSFVAWMLDTDVEFTSWNLYQCMIDDGEIVRFSEFAGSYVKQWRKCYSKFWLAFAISMNLLLVTTMSIGVMLDKNSLRLKCLFLRWMGIRFQVPKREDFLHDIFVYYSSKDDHTWVCNTFRQKMEEERGLRLCIPDRDFVPGSCTAEEILEAIHNSWKTVVYMTDVFLEDELCSFTLSSAVHASTSEMPNRLILIYSNEIFNIPLPPIVTQLLDGDYNFMLEELEELEQWDILYHKTLCWV